MTDKAIGTGLAVIFVLAATVFVILCFIAIGKLAGPGRRRISSVLDLLERNPPRSRVRRRRRR